jgi:hypothetical protein
MPYDGVPPCHALDADGKNSSHNGRKPLRHGSNRKSHTEDEDVEQSGGAADVRDHRDDDDHEHPRSRRPRGTSPAIEAVSSVTGMLSPVSAASDVCSATDAINRPPTGVLSPSSMMNRSPGTTSDACTLCRSPRIY